MYSPAERPSSIRAAPAKKRIWSTIGGISSARVSPIGLPVFSDSAAISSSARASNASAIFSRAFWRSAGRRVAPGGEGGRGGGHRGVDVRRAGERRGGVDLAGRRVDHRRWSARRRRPGTPRRCSCADDAVRWSLCHPFCQMSDG